MQLSKITECLPQIYRLHAPTNSVYKVFEEIARDVVLSSSLMDGDKANIDLDGYGKVFLPYHNMGAIDSLHLFGLDELIIFSFYWLNRARYKRSADLGANLGLHSVLMNKCGWSVDAYEPDPVHAKLLRSNLVLNNSVNVNVFESAVSDKDGIMEFTRVLGNTTSSHLSGAKPNAYGELEHFQVNVVNIDKIMEQSDFIKMDVEAQEAVILLSTNSNHWINTDMMLEVGTTENATKIFQHLSSIGVNLFAQKIGWQMVKSIEDMPTHYKQGSLFVTCMDSMPWVKQ